MQLWLIHPKFNPTLKTPCPDFWLISNKRHFSDFLPFPSHQNSIFSLTNLTFFLILSLSLCLSQTLILTHSDTKQIRKNSALNCWFLISESPPSMEDSRPTSCIRDYLRVILSLPLPLCPCIDSDPQNDDVSDDGSVSNRALSKSFLVLDVVWNLGFVLVSIVGLLFTMREKPSSPLRVWIGGYGMQCLLHVGCVYYDYQWRINGQGYIPSRYVCFWLSFFCAVNSSFLACFWGIDSSILVNFCGLVVWWFGCLWFGNLCL